MGGVVETAYPSAQYLVRSIAVQSDGNIVLGGAKRSDTHSDLWISRVFSNGTRDEQFGLSGSSTVDIETHDNTWGISIQPDGKILSVGSTYDGLTETRFAITRHNSDGSIDMSFGSNGILSFSASNGYAYDAVGSIDGNLFVAGRKHNTLAVAKVIINDLNNDGISDEWDLTPVAPIPQSKTPVQTASYIYFDSNTLSGLGDNVSVLATIEGGEFSVNSDTIFSNTPRFVRNLDKITVRHRSAEAEAILTPTKLLLGGRYSKGSLYRQGQVVTTEFKSTTNSSPIGVQSVQFSVQENEDINYLIGSVPAADVDEQPLRFSFESGNELNEFRIDNNGNIFVNKSLDHESVSAHELVVRVQDTQDGTLLTNVKIEVLNINEKPILSAPSAFSVSENAVIGHQLGRITAQDPEGDAIEFSIDSGNTGNVFSIDAFGELSVAKALDFETKASYELSIVATDTSGANGVLVISVLITDVVESSPPPPPVNNDSGGGGGGGSSSLFLLFISLALILARRKCDKH